MPRNGSGTYSPPSGNPVASGATISSVTHNNTITDLSIALTGSIARDGQAPFTANQPFGGFKATGVGTATLRGDATNLGNIQDGTGTYIGTVGGNLNSITINPAPPITAYQAGQRFSFIASGTNTGAMSLDVSGLGVVALTKNGATAIIAGDVTANALVEVEHDGTRFQLLNQATANFVDKTSAQTIAGAKTFSDAVVINSTLATSGAITAPSLALTTALPVASGGTGVTASTGTGNNVLSISPTLTTPALGTPSALVGTNITGTSNSLNTGIGVNQTWTDVTSSRSAGTTYTNNTSKPIQVMFTCTTGSATVTATINAITMNIGIGAAGFFNASTWYVIVPVGNTYSVSSFGAGQQSWVELR